MDTVLHCIELFVVEKRAIIIITIIVVVVFKTQVV